MQRQFMRDGDTTTTGGTVHASGSRDKIDGLNTCLEGDPVYCPACKSMGVTKCVPPLRPYTYDGKQVNLDGDLCICKCPTPPRLKSKFNNSAMIFDASGVVGNVAAAGWLVHAGYSLAEIGITHSLQFNAVDEETGQPFANQPYRITREDGTHIEGVTDANGNTEVVYSKTTETLKMEVPYYGNHYSESNTNHGHDTCSC